MTANTNPILNALILRNGRIEGGAFSIVQLASGAYMLMSKSGKLPGLILLQTGFTAAYYTYRQTQETFQWKGLLSQTAESALIGGIGGAFGSFFQGASAFVKICTGVVSGFFGSAAAEACHQMYEHGQVKDKKVVLQKACSGGVGGLAGSVTSTGFDRLATEMGTVTKVVFEIVKGSASSGANKMARNVHDGQEVLRDVLEVALIGGGMSGVIATVQEWQLSKEMSKVQEQKSQAEKVLQAAQENKAKHEANLKKLQQGNDKPVDIAKAHQNLAEATKQLTKLEAQSKQVLQSYESAQKSIAKEVKTNLAKGYKASINHKNVQDAQLISEALLNGQKVIWLTNDPTNRFIHRTPNFSKRQYENTERYVQEARLEIAQIQAVLLAESRTPGKQASYAFQGLRIESLKDVFKVPPVTYVDCDMQELIKHVILVHAVCGDTIERFSGYESLNLEDHDEIAHFLLKKLLTPDGSFGMHLQMEKSAFSGKFLNRPQIHWAWNQLVQTNVGGLDDGWEKPSIIILEPLAVFENSTSHRPFAVAPYDTQVFESICLSKESTILVPQNLVDKSKILLPDFQGRIVGYDPSKQRRNAVMGALLKYYPQTWHVCSPKGELLGEKAHYTRNGYETKTCLKTDEGKIIVLLHAEGKEPKDQLSQAMKDYANKANRFIGLHVNSTTYWLESNPYFKLLEQALSDKAILKKEPLFAGHLKKKIDIETVGVLTALKFYRQLLGESALQTGCFEVANYVLKEAIFADIISLFFQVNPQRDFTFTKLDLQMMISPLLATCKKLLLQMEHYANADQKRAQELYGQYCDLLKESLNLLEQAQKETLPLLNNEPVHFKQLKVDFAEADKLWEVVPLPEEISCDLGKSWPLAGALHSYASQVFQLLPREVEDLKACYQQLCQEKSAEQREQYRLNVLCSATRYAIQEQIYLGIQSQKFVSSLATLFTAHEGWLKAHHLETADFTKKIGDCLFDNIIAQVAEFSSKTAHELRNELVKFMEEHTEEYQTKPDFYKENFLEVGDGTEALHFTDWKSYLEVLGKPQVWATELEIQALSMLLQRPIVLISVEGLPKIYHEQGKNLPIFLNHKNWNHYESCRPLSPHTVQEIYQMIKQESHY